MAMLDEVIAVAGLGAWEIDDGDRLACDASLRAIYGELPTTLAELLARIPDEERPLAAAAIAARTAFELEHRLVRSGGAVRLVHTRARPFGTRLVATVEDITERQERLAELVFADRMAAVATLAGGLAHEINNPLAFIAFNLDVVQGELRAPRGTDRWNELDTMLVEAREGVARIQRIVRSVALFARKTEDHRVPLALERVVERALEATASELRHRARIVRAFGPAPHVLANETRLAQVFVHLLQNAAAALPEGHADAHEIRATIATEAGRAIVEIADSGHGIALADRARVFDPFFTTRPVGGGLGLGLSICHGIVRALGGEITVQSELGAGTVFRVSLPGAPAADADAPARARPAPRATRRGKVLIVDDEVVFATSLRRLLGRDHDVVVMSRGRDALDAIAAGTRYDAILCDLMMPEMTGMELHARLLEQAPDQADRMVFVTGGAFTVGAQEFLERLPTPWFEKPCDVAELRNAIAALIG